MNIETIQEELVDEFALFDDWMQRYEHIIEMGKSLPMIEEQYKTEDRLIKGCQSKVWLHSKLIDGKVVFTASFHLKRGYCCRSGCRHCPFNHKPESEKEKAPLERDALG